MKHKTWFRLVIKAIGVLLVGFGTETLIEGVIYGIAYLEQITGMGGGMTFFPTSYLIARPVGGLAVAAFGLYLFFGGAWIVNKAIPSNRPYCPECGYDLSHSAAGATNCPECGVALPARTTNPTP